MVKWEYQVLRLRRRHPAMLRQMEEQLNAQGETGWELVTTEELPTKGKIVYFAVFKRPCQD